MARLNTDRIFSIFNKMNSYFIKAPTHRIILLCLAAVVFIVLTLFFWDYSIDDSFITFRYAEHLADGHGLVFNIGGEPVEGYSNLLWLLILALLYKIGLPTYFMAKLLGLFAFLGTGFLWFKYFNKNTGDNNIYWLAGPMFLVFPATVFWGLSGLELGLHALIISLCLISLFNRSKSIYIWLPLLVLNRPEGPAIALVILVTALIVDLAQNDIKWKYYLSTISIVLLVTCALIVFRMIVFGHPLPNTYYAKTYHIFSYGVGITLNMLYLIIPYIIALFTAGIFIIKRRLTDKRITVMIVLVIAQLFISVSVDPVMNFHYRYLIPIIPALIIVSLYSVSMIKKAALNYGAIAILAGTLFIPLPGIIDSIKYDREILASQEDFIEWARPLPQNTTISMTDMGRIPYYTEKTYFDIWGLLNEDIGHKGFNPVIEFNRKPDYFVMVGYMESQVVTLRFLREQEISKNKGFLDIYKLVNICKPEGDDHSKPGYYYLVFKKRIG